MNEARERCAACRHWRSGDYDFSNLEHIPAPREDWGYCLRTITDGNHPSEDDYLRSVGSLALALDHEYYYAELWTHRAFGCVQFEEGESCPNG